MLLNSSLASSNDTDILFLLDAQRIKQRIEEGEAKRKKQDVLWKMLSKKIAAVQYPMQELELNYPTTKGKIYSEEEDRYLLCRLHYYGLKADDVYERIKRDITEFPVFRFDWFFKSRTPQELQRRCTTLLGLIEKEAEQEQEEEHRAKSSSGRGKKRAADEPVTTSAAGSKKGSRANTPPLTKGPKKARA